MNRAESNSWRRVKLKEVCEKITVGHVGPMVNEYVDSGVPFLRSQNIQPFKLDIAEMKHITPEFHKKLSKSALHPGDVAIVRTGYPGTAAVIPKRFTELNCADLVIARPTSHLLDPWYLTCIFNSTWGRGAVAGNLVGVAQQHFNVTAAKEMEVLLPDLPTQRRIASILSAHDDLIENNTRRIAILEEMARRIYEEWFVRFRFPGHEQVKMVESELGLIPEGWSLCRLDELYKTASGGTPSRRRADYFGGNINWVKTQELQDNWIFETSEKITEIGLANSSAKIFPTGTVLVAMYGATIGQLGILGVAAATNQACCAVIPSLENFGTTYAYLTLQVRRQELIDLRAGAAQQNINQIVVRQFPMLAPSDHSLLPRFTATVTPLLELSSVLQRTNANLRATRDLLLPKLISGELDVSSLPEPEEVITA